jgi:prepilin-type processing-associated H-X9-DG protein
MPDATPSPRTSPLAVVSLLLGLLSVLPLLFLAGVLAGLLGGGASLPSALPLLGILGGLLALLTGFVALRFINVSDGRFRGRRPAIAGMVLGGLGTLGVPVLGFLAIMVLGFREDAARVGCQNNLRVIGLAVNAYRDEHEEYPEATIPNPALAPDRRLSWLVSTLPYLEKEPPQAKPRPGQGAAPHRDVPRITYERIDRTRAWDDADNHAAVSTPLHWFLCPADPSRALRDTLGLTDYVGLAGLGPDAAALPAGDPRAGFFGYDRVLTWEQLQEDHGGRGTSSTLMVVETAYENGPWAQGGPATVRGVDTAQRPYAGVGRPFGGNHPGGFNVLFADGSGAFLRNSIDPEKLEALVPIKAP